MRDSTTCIELKKFPKEIGSLSWQWNLVKFKQSNKNWNYLMFDIVGNEIGYYLEFDLNKNDWKIKSLPNKLTNISHAFYLW